MRSARIVSLLAIIVTVGCAGEAPIPADDELNWYLDVQPILRGSCFHCHGAIPQGNEGAQHAERGTTRWDICDLAAPAFADIIPAFGDDPGIGSANVRSKLFQAGYLKPVGESRKPTMPPPPAELLSSRDTEVVLRWAELADPPCGSRVDNLRPRVALVGRTARSGDTLTATLDVTDGDHDQVLGKLTCGTAEAPIRSSGRVTVSLDVADLAPGSATLTALVSDGLDRTQRNLGACP